MNPHAPRPGSKKVPVILFINISDRKSEERLAIAAVSAAERWGEVVLANLVGNRRGASSNGYGCKND